MNEPEQQRPTAKQMFLEACLLTCSQQRRAYLSRVCGCDTEMLRNMEAMLLVNQEAMSSPLDRMGALFGAARETDVHSTRSSGRLPGIGGMMGRYKLLEQIGQGGFGTVFMAEQTEPVRRKVALKVLKPGMDSSEVIARFEVERQALAMMDHPGIARVLDGDTTDQGHPYFVMELVRGIPVTEYCDEARATTEERLQLFIDICRAVHHAHQKGIIHRDLKPSNVLVTMHDDKAVPKVIDFGIAKALSQQLTDRTLFTGYHQMLGTPAYMSPEQAQMSGIDIDTRSDVYSLGVLLYELMTGTTPFDKTSMAQVSLDDLRRMICEQDPPRPSSRITTMEAGIRSTIADHRRIDHRRVSEQLRGELDWIVMRSLEKDRNRRYESVSALAADVQRYLDNEQVQACPPTVWYRLQKFSRRNRVWLTTSAICAGILIAASGVSVDYAVQAQKALREADEQRQQAVAARKVSEERLQQSRVDFDRALQSLDMIVSEASSVKFSQLPGVEPVRADILQKAMAFYEEIIGDHQNDAYARAHRAMALHKIAKIHDAEGEPQKFLESLNEAIAEMEAVLNESPDDNTYRAYMVSMLSARMHIGHQATSQRVSDAKRCLEITLQMKDSGAEVAPSWLAFLTFKVAEALTLKAPDADQYVRQSMEITTEAGIDHVPGTLIWLGDKDVSAGRLQDAVRNYSEGIELYERWANDPSNRQPHVERCILSTERSKLASVVERLGNISDAETLIHRSFEDAVVLATQYQTIDWYQHMLQFRAVELLEFLSRNSRMAEADTIVSKLEETFPDNQTPHMVKAALAELQDRTQDARRHFEAAEAVDPADATLPRRYAEFLMRQDDHPAAIRELEKTLAMEPGQWWMRKRLAVLRFNAGLQNEALKDLRRAVEVNPQDLSVMTCLGIRRIAACREPGFHQAYLKLVDDAAALNRNLTYALRIKAIFHTLAGNAQKARSSLRSLLENAPSDPFHLFQTALLSAQLHDAELYAKYSQKSYEQFAESTDREARHFVVWTAVLAPAAMSDYGVLQNILPALTADQVGSISDHLDRGGLAFRSGDFVTAGRYLQMAADAQPTDSSDSACQCYARYFLAMNEQQQKNTDAAQKQLAIANELAAELLADNSSWNRRLTIQLLQAEASR